MMDLHTHTTASDGALGPRELVRRAARKGLTVLAVTDHDTLEGWEPAFVEGKRLGLRVIPGVELSLAGDGGDSFHLLGYLFDPHHPGLQRLVRSLQEARRRRNAQILQRLREAGIHLSRRDVEQASGALDTWGRFHLAQALVRKGYARTMEEALAHFVGRGAPFDAPKQRLSAREVIPCLHRAGGIAVLAHPGQLDWSEAKLEACVASLTEEGLDGIEAYYPLHTPEQTAFYEDLAHRFELVLTGGSDFHGPHRPHLRLGCVRGDAPLPCSLLEPLLERAERWRCSMRLLR
jgi:hypothetical protein